MFVTIARDVRYKAQWFILKALHTFGNVQRPVFPFSVSQHMHTTNLWNLDSIGQLKLQEKNDEKTPLFSITHVCAFRCLKRHQSWSCLIFGWEITSLSKTALPLREPFLTIFYTINSSQILDTEDVLILTIILINTNNVQCPWDEFLDHYRIVIWIVTSQFSQQLRWKSWDQS